MADNRFQLGKSADEGPINPIEETKRLEVNLATREKAKIARERKIQTSPASKNRNKTNFKCKQVKENSEFSAIFRNSATFCNFKNKIATFRHIYRQLFENLSQLVAKPSLDVLLLTDLLAEKLGHKSAFPR